MTSDFFRFPRYASFDSVDACVSLRSFCGPLVPGSHLFGAVCCYGALENAEFLGKYPGLFPHSALSGSTVDTSMASVLRGFGYFTYFQLRWCFCLSTETGLHSANCCKSWRFHSAVLRWSLTFTVRGAEAYSFGSGTIEILHLQFIGTVFSMSVGRSSNFGCRLGEDSRDPRNATRLLFYVVVAWPVVCNNRCLVVKVLETEMHRSCCSRGMELIVASCHRSLKSCRCSACSIGVPKVHIWRL